MKDLIRCTCGHFNAAHTKRHGCFGFMPPSHTKCKCREFTPAPSQSPQPLTRGKSTPGVTGDPEADDLVHSQEKEQLNSGADGHFSERSGKSFSALLLSERAIGVIQGKLERLRDEEAWLEEKRQELDPEDSIHWYTEILQRLKNVRAEIARLEEPSS